MYKYLAIAGVLVVGLLLTACSPTEKAVESAIESQSNQDVDVDIDNDQVTLNTNSGSLQVGDSVDLPDNFPSDVPVTDGTITAAVATSENDGFSVSIQSSQTVDQVKAEYESALVDDGWEITATLDIGGNVSLSAEKDARFTSVGIADVDGQTTVTLTTGSNE